VISPTLIPLPDNTQHSQEIDIHTPGRIRTYNPSKRAAADSCLRTRGHWDRQCYLIVPIKVIIWHQNRKVCAWKYQRDLSQSVRVGKKDESSAGILSVKAKNLRKKIGTGDCLQYSLLLNLPQSYCITITPITKNLAD
jgi:hypothetical protein